MQSYLYIKTKTLFVKKSTKNAQSKLFLHPARPQLHNRPEQIRATDRLKPTPTRAMARRRPAPNRLDLKEAVQIEADLYPEKTIKKYGCEITKKMNSSYNFDLCGDSELVRLQDLAKETSEKLKQRQDFLKMIRGELTIVNSVTGEITTIYEPDVKKSDVISIKVL